VRELQFALQEYRNAPEASDQPLAHAFTTLCREAHAAGLGPEKMLATVKYAWRLALGRRDERDPRWRALLEPLVTRCIEPYYRSVPQNPDPQ
jgi:hypothetical protein